MRAQFIYEKFTEDSDPIRDLGIGAYELLPKLILQNDKKRMFFTSAIYPNKLQIWVYMHSVSKPQGYYRKYAAKDKKIVNEDIIKDYLKTILEKINMQFLLDYMSIDLYPAETTQGDVSCNVTFFYNFNIKRSRKYKREMSSTGTFKIHPKEKNIIETLV